MRTTLQRRAFLRAFAAATAATRWPAFARSPEGQVFDDAVAGQPWLKPFKGVTDQDLRCDALSLSGKWPAEFRGRFYRNGPALNERDGQRYHHWFAGDGMVQQFSFSGGAKPAVRHLGRLVRTPKLVAEQKAGKFLFNAYGTRIEGGEPAQGPDSFNVANTNAMEHAGRVLAMWEGGSAFALSPDDLATLGPVTWQQGLAQMPFSAHPKLDAKGNLWNFGSAGANLVVWHVDPMGQLVKAQIGESPYPGGMAHDAAITERHIVLPLPPVKLNFGEDVTGGKAFTHEPKEPLRILVMKKDDIAQRRVFELPSQMVFHVGNAHERADGSIVLSFVSSPTPEFLMHGASSLVAGHPASFGGSSTQLAVLDMRTGKVRVEGMQDTVEFPRAHPLRNGQATRHLLTVASWDRGAGRPQWFHGLQLRDLQTGRTQRHDYGPGTVVEEHIVVPKPGKQGELDAWLLGTSFDTANGVTRVNLLDARHLADGPVAQATLPYGLPYGFHGNFTAA
ncbi:carotenoid oxygenase family protein [Ideonella azotifigens]|uniref:Carotenoid oxygenase family protein n=1 Tax=Ideonella azotifigens TaxID=513160 RepID=A0ABN1JJL8_9BURK|nr:carotenoid oxygenase family protein [Ideonella azotifigens]MCD2341942.1 carotenoid oxygenase family protein [Ideonella azotifigens]